jgi:mono/diheme cytochrome c family protein
MNLEALKRPLGALFLTFAAAAAATLGSALAQTPAATPEALYADNCAACHGPDRLGRMGPALLPQSLERLSERELTAVLRDGRVATQMAGFADRLSDEQRASIARWLRSAPAQTPRWELADMLATHTIEHAPGALPARPVFKADPRNLFLVVEAGDHHLSVLDGDSFEPIHRFATHFALHGGPKFSHDGRYVFVASRDGWVSKYDLWNLALVAEIRVALNTRNLAVSDDGRWVMAGNSLPETLVLLRASDLRPERIYPVRGENGKTSRVSAVYDAAPRKSFVVALRDIPELWEISYDPKAEPVAEGLVHDYQFKEGAFRSPYLRPRRIALDAVLDDFFFTQNYANVIGASREAARGQVVNLDVRHKIADLDLSGMPHLGSGITWQRDGRWVMATPNLQQGKISVIDMQTWKTIAQIDTNGPGFFIRSHENTPYAWVDAMMSPKYHDTLQIIDKRSLQVVGSVTPSPGHTAAHVEFTRDGRYALVSLMEVDGAIVVYDAATWRAVKRIPMVKPVGKYNVFNKTTRSSGTSH